MNTTSIARNAKVLFILCIVSVAAVACSTKETRWAEPEAYELRVIDNLPEGRFDLILRSNSQRELCLTREQWPNRSGQLHMGSSTAKVRTGTDVFPALDENFGYCPGNLSGCDYHRIDPYGELRGYIDYETFNEHEALATDPNKQLEFSVYPFYCR